MEDRTMTTNSDRGSATIYTFPARGRFAAIADTNAAKLKSPEVARVAYGSSWYHDEAIQQAERARTKQH